MPFENSCHMWVFREGRSTVRGTAVLDGLRAAVHRLPGPGSGVTDRRVNALLRAGELECALADAASPDLPWAAALTDALAAALVERPGWPVALEQASVLLAGIRPPQTLSISPPEGFAYYALHPLDFADLAQGTPLRGKAAAVVGIRSIGTTLSAVVTASLERRGVQAQRITVRPTGHPYDRRSVFSAEQLRWIAAQRAAEAEFLVVDEGPGISGSSFLSVADALLQAGVARQHITFFSSRQPDPEKLAAKDGAVRWRSYRSLAVRPTAQTPADHGLYLGGGEWRRLFAEESRWPPSWTQMERMKFLSGDGRRLYKYQGLGRFGEAVAARAALLGEAGFAPRLLGHTSGFSEFPFLDAPPMDATGVSAPLLERLAEYCALRALEFASPPEPSSQLEGMVRFNVGEEFGREAAAALPELICRRRVIPDGRMLPHEWLRTASGTLIKVDGDSHGDDHFFPGPADIAWDLAGAAVEWKMTTDAIHYMLDRYRRRSGDDVGGRMEAYMLAYSVFRMAYCSMAAFVQRGSAEVPRLWRAARHYRALVEALLKAAGCRPQPSAKRNAERGQTGPTAERAFAAGDAGADAA